ncbi:hypothetical protein [Ralstonia phage RpT1]|nr:hypothetical protein [Ralstonia phage RpT1]
MTGRVEYLGHGPDGGIQEHSKGPLSPLVAVVTDHEDGRKRTHFIDPRKDGKDVTGKWANPFLAHKWALLYLWGYKFDPAKPLGPGLCQFAEAEGRTCESLYAEAEAQALAATNFQGEYL